MNRDDIIRMAREQGDFIDDKGGGAFIFNGNPEHTFNIFKFAALVAAAEREECVKVCESVKPFGPHLALQKATIEDCTAAIRSRGHE